MNIKPIAAAAIVAIASQASAEIVPLAQNGYWETELFVSDAGNLSCHVANFNGDQHFSLGVNEAGEYAMLIFEDADVNEDFSDYIDMNLEISGVKNGKWVFSDSIYAETAGSYSIEFWFGPNTQGPFVADLMLGNYLSLKGDDGKTYANWSLTGSSAAIIKMDECRQKIMGKGA